MQVIAISAGHNKGTGARAHDGTDEWSWNMIAVRACKCELERLGYKVEVLYRDQAIGYTAAMRKLGRAMRRVKAVAALEFHFNASGDEKANGFEMLYWWGSKNSKKLARCVADSFAGCFRGLVARGDRGVRSLWFHKWNKRKAYSGRGGAYCFLTPCPAVICEPGFGTNRIDWFSLVMDAEVVGIAYARGVDKFLKGE